MDFIKKEDNSVSCRSDFLFQRIESTSKGASHRRTCDKLRYRDLDDNAVVIFIPQDCSGNSSGNARLSNASSTNQAGVVSMPLGQDVEGLFNLRRPPHNWIGFSQRGGQGQVSAYLSQNGELLFRKSPLNKKRFPALLAHRSGRRLVHHRSLFVQGRSWTHPIRRRRR